MTDSKITISIFAERTADAPLATKGYWNTDGQQDDLAPYAAYVLAEFARGGCLNTHWAFADYEGAHNGQDIKENSAIVLEYKAVRAPAVRAALKREGWAFYELEAAVRTGKRSTPTSVFAIATTGIQDSQDYTRIASVLAYQVDQYDLIPGSLSNTFLFSPLAMQGFQPGSVLDDYQFKRETARFKARDAYRYYKAKPKLAMPVFSQSASTS